MASNSIMSEATRLVALSERIWAMRQALLVDSQAGAVAIGDIGSEHVRALKDELEDMSAILKAMFDLPRDWLADCEKLVQQRAATGYAERW